MQNSPVLTFPSFYTSALALAAQPSLWLRRNAIWGHNFARRRTIAERVHRLGR